MITKETLDYFKELDRLRIEARSLRDQGLDAILDFDLSDDSHWEQEISDNEKVLFRRAKHLAWSLGKIEEHKCEHGEDLYFSRDEDDNKPEQYDRTVRYPPWPVIDLPSVNVAQLRDPIKLCERLKRAQGAKDPKSVSYYIFDQFVRNRDPFDEYKSGQPADTGLLKCLVSMLNSALAMPALYEQVQEANTVKLSAATKRLIDDDPKGGGLVRLNRRLLDETYPEELEASQESLELFHMPDEPAPILFAANFLRTRLGNLRGYLDEETLSCYYRVVRELYNLHNTNWALGAARPGEHSGKPSVFVTTECSRAIGYFARLMENTSQFLARMHETKQYVDHVNEAQHSTNPLIPKLPAVWCESELACCFVSVKTTIEAYRDYVAILLPDLRKVSDLNDTIEQVEQSVSEFAAKSTASFDAVKDWVKILREAEQKSRTRSRQKQSEEIKKVKLQQMPELDLTETAHRIAWGALAGARQEFKKLKEKQSVLLEAAEVFATLAKWLRTHLDPAKEYFEKVLHKCLAENAREHSPKIVQDLAFSALSVGLITKDWSQRDCQQAIEILCDNIDEGGQFPEGLPFAYTPKGEGRVVINAQVIRAFAQLAQHLPDHPNVDVVRKLPLIVGRMNRYFQSQAIDHKNGIAWSSLSSLKGERSSLWITSISVLALHRIVLMLDAHINHGVKQRLSTKTPADLRAEGIPYLHQLMCTDIGYVTLQESQDPSIQRVMLELEGMRAHLIGSARVNDVLRTEGVLEDRPLRSLILNGPPGTGKTTLVKSLAVTSNVDFVEVMSHDLYHTGTERVMDQASLVMDALKLLTGTVILFDEFEPILHVRTEHPRLITEMLTGNMLPKLDALYKAAGQNRLVYVMATNYVERLDSAAIRAGRFDQMRFLYYPDAASRACRLASELRYLLKSLQLADVPLPPEFSGANRRLSEVVAMTARCYITRLCSSGWFVAPKTIKTIRIPSNSEQHSADEGVTISQQSKDKLRPVWRYVIWGEPSESLDWLTLFGSAEKTSAESAQPDDDKKAEFDRRIVKAVKERDEGLRNLVQANPEFGWDQTINLLTKPFVIRSGHDSRVDAERRISGERRSLSAVAKTH
jgi:hypothetical protein